MPGFIYNDILSSMVERDIFCLLQAPEMPKVLHIAASEQRRGQKHHLLHRIAVVAATEVRQLRIGLPAEKQIEAHREPHHPPEQAERRTKQAVEYALP